MSVETYECDKCGARFGIAGVNTGSDEDYAADDYFNEQVEWHESGECLRAARRARWRAIKALTRPRGEVLPVRPSVIRPPLSPAEARARRLSTRASRRRAARGSP